MSKVHNSRFTAGFVRSVNHAIMRPSFRVGVLFALAWLLIGAVCVYIATSPSQDMLFLQKILEPFEGYISNEKAVYSPIAYFLLFSVTVFLERRIPVREQPVLSVSLAQDALWYIGTLILRVTFLAGYSALLYGIYHEYLSALTIESAANWHPAVRFVVAVLVADFFRWLSHLIVHKVPAFWIFHEVHHSQTELNIFTDARVHPVDRMIAGSIKFIPMFMLDNALPVIMAWAVFETIYPKFYHANVRLNFGPLRYILVTPQSHRVHHGVGPAYHDKNFGFTFCIWDRMFGTQYHDYEDYPATGIIDNKFPQEREASPTSLLKLFLLQLIYPFQKLLRALHY